MRISASGLESTIAVAIDQILRLAPSSRPPIEPVVSSTKATSTAGFALACDRPEARGRVARANASERSVMRDFMDLLQMFRPLGTQVSPATRWEMAENKASWGRNCG